MKLRYILPVAAALACMVSCGKKEATTTSSEGIAKIACDESFERIMEQEVEVYEYIYPKASILPYYVNEKAAVDSLLNLGTVRTAVIARELNDKEVAYLKSHGKNIRSKRIAVDAIALIVNPANSIELLSKQEIGEILAGKITKWNEIEPNKLGEIKVVFDHQGSSTVQYMRDSLLVGDKFGPNVHAQNNNEEVFKAVAENPNAIGVIGVSWISSDLGSKEMSTEQLAAASEANDTTTLGFNQSVKVLKVRRDDEIKGVQPYQAYIFDGSYPLYRSVYMITVATGGTTASGFFAFVTGFQGQKLIQMTGVLPATVTPRMVSLD